MVMLQLEDHINDIGSKYEYINSENVFRIRVTGKKIRIYSSNDKFIYVEKTEHNIEEFRLKLGIGV